MTADNNRLWLVKPGQPTAEGLSRPQAPHERFDAAVSPQTAERLEETIFQTRVLLDLEQERALMYRVGLILELLAGLVLLRAIWLG